MTKSLLQRKKYNVLKIVTCDPSIYTMDHPDLTISNFMGNSIGTQSEPAHEILVHKAQRSVATVITDLTHKVF